MKKLAEQDERIEMIMAGIRSMLRNAKTWDVEFQRGTDWEKLRPTGAYTITIEIDSGSGR